MVGAAESHIRNNGVYLDVEKDVEVIFKHEKSIATNENNTVTTFKNNILGYLKDSSSDIKVGEKYLGSSEIIESVFGKQKNIHGEQARSGFTGLILTVGALVADTTTEVIKLAMESVSTKTVQEWQKEKIGQSIQSKKIKLRAKKENDEKPKTISISEQNGNQLLAA